MLPREYILKFCAIGDIRFHLNTPAREDGKLWASDGHILIVTDDDQEISVLSDSPLPTMAKQFIGAIDSRDNWIPVDMPLPPPVACFICGGIGKTSECSHCEGDGFIIIEHADKFDEEQQCPKCNGRPEWPDANGTPCWKCGGSGEGILTIPVGNTHFQRRYLALLQSLPGPVMLSTGPVYSDIAFFQFNGGYGALMPCWT